MQSERKRDDNVDIGALVARAPRDPEAFAAWVAMNVPENLKFELSRGEVRVMQAGTSFAHNRICQNIVREMERRIDLDIYAVFHADFAVETAYGARYPDVMVFPVLAAKTYSSTNAIFLAEVLSPSSPGVDFLEKALEYGSVASAQTHLICAQDEPRAWAWHRAADGTWPQKPETIAGREGKIPLGGLGIEISMAAIFRGIPDAPEMR